MPLYKYCRPDILQFFIEHPRVRFTPPSEFNDPFEFLCSADALDDPAFVQLLWSHYEPEFQVKLAVASAAAQRGAPSISALRRQFSAEVARRKPVLRKAFVHAGPIDTIGVLSLTRISPDSEHSMLPWGHYAQCHTGFVIELDEAHPTFQSFSLGNDSSKLCRPVTYSKARPTWRFSGNRNSDDLLFTKDEHWAYEDEVRYIIPIGAPELESDPNGKLTLLPLEPSAVLSITFGVKCDPEIKRAAYQAMSCGKLAHLIPHRVFQAELAPFTYRVTRAELDTRVHLADSFSTALLEADNEDEAKRLRREHPFGHSVK